MVTLVLLLLFGAGDVGGVDVVGGDDVVDVYVVGCDGCGVVGVVIVV